MRKFLTLICFLIPYCCFAQFFDDFSDPSAFKNNGWQGNSTHFYLSDGSLRLNNTAPATTGTTISYLSAPFSRTGDEATWLFDIRIAFNPSANNHAVCYLISNQKNLTLPLRGYSLRLGGTEDEIELCREENGTVTPLIRVPKRLTAQNMNEVIVGVTCKNGTWRMVSRFNSEKDFREEGSVSESSPLSLSSGYTGWKCIYTKTNASRFYLNRLAVDSDNGVIVPPVDPEPETPGDTIYISAGTAIPSDSDTLFADSVRILDAQKVLMYMNTPVNITKGYVLCVPSEYTPSIRPTQYPHIVHVTLAYPMQKGNSYCLMWGGFFNPNGKLLNFGAYTFNYGEVLPEDPTIPDIPADPDGNGPLPSRFGEVIITEIMANPKGVSGLPEVEYVEVMNHTERSLSLEGCRFYYATKGYPLSACTLHPGERVILCHPDKAPLFDSDIRVLPVSSFPVLANTGKMLYLENKAGRLLHWIEYSDKWYASSAQKNGGYALEMIDTDHLFSSSRNWTGAVAGGTPGKPNSVTRNNPDTYRPYLKGYFFESPNSLLLSFSKSIDTDVLNTVLSENFGSGYTYAFSDYPRNTSCLVSFPTGYPRETLPELDALTCTGGLPLFERGTPGYGTAVAAGKEAIVLNEVLIKNRPGSAPFIELINTSSDFHNLSEWSIALLGKDSTIISHFPLASENTLCEPGGYILISDNPHAVFDTYGYHGTPQIVTCDKFPQITTSNDVLAITNSAGEILESFRYQSSLHAKENSDLTGISLERRNPFKPASLRGNWTSGNVITGFASPGYPNSADSTVQDISTEGRKSNGYFSILHRSLRLQEGFPDSELTLLYELPSKKTRLTATLYTSNGIKVCRMATDMELPESGEINWKREWKTRQSDTPGIYLLIVEYVSDTGISGKEKLALPVIP